MTNTMVDLPDRDVRLGLTDVGSGPPVLLVHGFPHTRRLWDPLIDRLADRFRCLAVDLRGFGDSTRAPDGYDAQSLADDLAALLDRLAPGPVHVVAIDAGVPPAFLLAVTHPHRLRAVALMEATLGTLAGAESVFAAGPPWWFGFHQVPGLAEAVLVGHEDEYLDFFYRTGTADGRGIDARIRDQFVGAFAAPDALRCAFEVYRAMPESGAQVAAAADARLRVPTLAIGAHPVGPALAGQLAPVTDTLQATTVPECGHLVPLDRPGELAVILRDFLGAH